MRILGTNFWGHDSAMFLLDLARKEIFAVSLERYTRIKHDGHDIAPLLRTLPVQEVDCIAEGYLDKGLDGGRIEGALIANTSRELKRLRQELDLTRAKTSGWLRQVKIHLAITARTLLRFWLLIKKRIAPRAATGKAITKYISKRSLSTGLKFAKLELYDHHLCHAASAYYFSPFAFAKPATVFTIDGSGDGYFSRCYLFDGVVYKSLGGSRTEILRRGVRKHFLSIGFIYSNFTSALGYKANSDEGKVEALAAYAERDKSLYGELRDCIKITHNGFTFDPEKAVKFYDIGYLRKRAERVGREAFAASVQHWLEDVVVEYLNVVHTKCNLPPILCMAGGVSANIIMGLNIFERTPFKEIYVFPAMADDGVAAGAAVLKALSMDQDISWLKNHHMPYYGPAIEEHDILDAISRNKKISAEKIGSEWPQLAAKSLADEKIIGIAHGRMEYGPRALGNRSILASPFDPKTKERMNLLVKRRPAFQPFCPSILEEERDRLFVQSFPHKHMAIAFRMREEFRKRLPSAVHIDGTARPQFVEQEDNPAYYRLLNEFKKITGFGVLINTSFNLHGRTIVRTAKDAITDFIDCGIDELYFEGYLILRKGLT